MESLTPNILLYRRQNGKISSMAICEPSEVVLDSNPTLFPIVRLPSQAFNFHGQMGDHQYAINK